MRIPLPASRPGRRVSFSFSDAMVALVSPAMALYIRDPQILSHSALENVGLFCLLSTGFSVLGLSAFRIQDRLAHYLSVHDAIAIVKAVIFSELMTCLVLFTLTRLEDIPRSTPLIHGLLLMAGLVAARILTHARYDEDDASSKHPFNREKIILIGANRFASFFIKMLNAYSSDDQRVVAVLDDRPTMVGKAISGVRILGTPDQLETIIAEFAIHGISTERVVIAGDADLVNDAAMDEIQRVCESRGVELCFLTQLMGVHSSSSARLAPSQESERPELPSVDVPAFFSVKRWIDIVGSLTLIVLLFPILVAASLLVLLDVGAPILFWQQRVGRNGRTFLIYKFRTMRPPFDQNGKVIPEHSQISAIGRALRATHVDELPQLFNVLVGDMSLIGPRPLLPEDQPSNARIRSLVRPGISGWAQVNGGKLVTPEKKQVLDEWYIRNASLWIDIYITVMTFRVFVTSTKPSEETLADISQAQTRNVVSWGAFVAKHDAANRNAPIVALQKPVRHSLSSPSAKTDGDDRTHVQSR